MCEHDLKKDYNAHTYEDSVISPTYDEGGYTLHTCSVCGYSYKDTYTNPIENPFRITYNLDGGTNDLSNPSSFNEETTTISRNQNGEYPQTKVTDSTLIEALNKMSSSNQDNQGYYTYNGEKYAYIDFVWRLVEPIKWRYMSTDESGYVQMVSQNVLTEYFWNSSTEQYEDGSYANNYYKSDIREWLNNEFLNEAFYYDASLLVITTVDNSASTTSSSTNEYACQNTEDKLYLLSYQDVNNKAYGFTVERSRVAEYDGERCYYWLRSNRYTSDVNIVSSYGDIYRTDVNNYYGVRVACKFNFNN